MADEGSGDLGRFAEPALLVLVSLAAGPKHGYAIMADVEEFSGTGIGPGTLYAVLARLEQRGLIEPLESEDRRRPYRVTASGAAAIEEQIEDLGRFVQIGRARLRKVLG
jgi:DNA-binding PadR family transcriptional regulator